MKRTFIQDPAVTMALEHNGVSDDDLREVELAVMRGGGKTVSGTGGLKKIRCGSAGRGKSGSVRIMFADYPSVGRVYLVAAFGKNEQADLSGRDRRDLREVKRFLDQAVERLVKHGT